MGCVAEIHRLTARLTAFFLLRGFIRLHCSSCSHDDIVAFSCKRPGVCPSRSGRAMGDGAVHLVDPSDAGRHDGRYLLCVADVCRAGAFLAGARVLAAGLALPFPLPMASRMA